jgi:peptide chain release factor 1
VKQSLQNRLARMQARLEEVNAALSSEDGARDLKLLRRLNQEHTEISEVLDHFDRYRQAERDLRAAEQMVSDPDMRDFAVEEIGLARERLATELAAIEQLLLPRDPNDSRNAIMEIRAGTGGDESALFAGDLLRMYLRYAERRGWKTEILSASESELGGYKEVIVQIEGDKVFGQLKFESGGHRVQRVPVTEAQGRIHTSACTVAVMAEADEVGDVQVSPDDLRIDVFRASGAGGQHVNKTESAVRITHLPSGIVAECQDDRSQHRNRDKAMKVLLTRLRDVQQRELHAKEAAHRKSLIGSGDRSERIRTYNFPQGRVTDHRINLTLYKLQLVMDGDLDELTNALRQAQIAEQVAALEELA